MLFPNSSNKKIEGKTTFKTLSTLLKNSSASKMLEKHRILDVQQCYPGIQLNVIFRSPKRVQSFFPFKDRFPTLIRSSVVYKFQCPGCHASYFGKTSRNLITRCREHLGINKAGQKIKVSPSAIGDHINQSGHAVSLEDFSVLDRANNDFDLLIHESLLILRDRPSSNSQLSSIPLALF